MPRSSRSAGRASCCSCRMSTGSASNASWRSSASIPAPIGSGSSSTTAGATPAARSAGPMVSRRSRCRPTAPNSTRRSAGSRRCAGSSPTPSSTLWMTSKPLSPKPFGPIGRTPPSSSAWSAIHGGAVPWQARTPTVLNQHESRVMAQNAYDTIRSKRYETVALDRHGKRIAARQFDGDAVLGVADDAARQQVHLGRPDEAGDEQVARMMVKLQWRSDLLDHAALKHDDLVGHGHGLDLVVGHIDHGRGQLLMQLGKLDPHLNAERRIQVGQRFVEQEDLGLPDDGAADGDALALTARKILGPTFQQWPQVQDVRRLGHLAYPLFLGYAGQPQAEGHVV